MDNPIIRRRQAESGLAGKFGIGGSILGGIIGAAIGGPSGALQGAATGNSAGSLIGGIAKPAKEGINSIQRRSGLIEQANGLIGAGAGVAGSIDKIGGGPVGDGAMPPGGAQELMNFTPDMEQELYRQRFLRRRIG